MPKTAASFRFLAGWDNKTPAARRAALDRVPVALRVLGLWESESVLNLYSKSDFMSLPEPVRTALIAASPENPHEPERRTPLSERRTRSTGKPTNDGRADRAMQLLWMYSNGTGQRDPNTQQYTDDVSTIVADVLADLQHYCEREEVNFARALRIATTNYGTERHKQPLPFDTINGRTLCEDCGPNRHTKDTDCTVDPDTLCCTVCGVDHSEECLECGQRGYHAETCPIRSGSGTIPDRKRTSTAH